MTDKEPKLDEKQISLFVEKFRALGLENPSAAKDVIEVLEDSVKVTKDEDYQVFEIARTICEILEPERLGGLHSWNCRVCKDLLTDEEVENKADTCFQCRITGREEPSEE